MRLIFTTLFLLVASLPAAGQTQLAQQCAAFGQTQYRKLDPSVEQVSAMEFPPPALERLDSKLANQAVAAALTLRGKLTYRNRAPFETQFVCLLDASERPLFFYALPALAARAAPTPITRGGPTQPPVPQLSQPVLPLTPPPPARHSRS